VARVRLIIEPDLAAVLVDATILGIDSQDLDGEHADRRERGPGNGHRLGWSCAAGNHPAPIPLVWRCTPETILVGLAKRGLPANTGLGERGTQVIAAPKRIIAPTGVAARGGLRCDDCGQPFEPAE